MKRCGLLACLIFLLNGCSFLQDKPVAVYQLSQMQHLQQRHNWYFEGRLSMHDEKNSITASINWRHGLGTDFIELSGPLAQGRVTITVQHGKVIIDDGDRLQEYGGPAEAVVKDRLGVDMPVNALKYWVLGVNDPAQPCLEQGDGFVQQGWLVRIRELQKINIEWLPKKITAEKDRAQIKLIVDQWELS